jgi:hypothetical protein
MYLCTTSVFCMHWWQQWVYSLLVLIWFNGWLVLKPSGVCGGEGVWYGYRNQEGSGENLFKNKQDLATNSLHSCFIQ